MFPSLKTSIPGPKSRELAARLRQVESSGITYLADNFPVFWVKSAGNYVWDVDDNCFLDWNSAFGVCGLGHTAEPISQAIQEQSQQIIHAMGDVHPPEVKVLFLESLLKLLPAELNRAILSCNGSDACESALKTAQLYTKKPGVIAFSYGYHGLGYGALDLTHKPHFRAGFEERLTDLTFHVDYPNPYHQGAEASLKKTLAQIENLLKTEKQIGSIIVEPIQGRGGVIVPPTDFLPALRQICDQHGLLLILDEIYTGFARTGTMFAFEEAGIIPDLLCLGKLIGGGLPLSICVGSQKIMEAWGFSNGESVHTSTFLGNPLACRAGLAVLETLSKTDLPKLNQEKSLYLRQKLNEIKSPFIGQVRGKGLMVGVELVKDQVSKQPFSELAEYMLVECLKRGLIILTSGTHGQVLSLSPPFTITEAEIDFSIQVLQDILLAAETQLVKNGQLS
jgi:4-aminobutyrate aminotransferase-like enzyme